MRNEALFLALDGAMMVVSIGLVTVFHPFMFFPFLKEAKKASKKEKKSKGRGRSDSMDCEMR